MNKAFLLTGSNIGDREGYLARACQLLSASCGNIISASHIYETAPWGKTDQPPFLNQALEMETACNAKQLIRRILKTEKMMGRTRVEKFGPRIIDIDILFFNKEKHNLPFLTLPHPEMQNRKFVLVPLAEIGPDEVHPVLLKPVKQLLEECKDLLQVTRYV